MKNELLDYDELKLEPAELKGNGLSGNGLEVNSSACNFDLYLSELNF